MLANYHIDTDGRLTSITTYPLDTTQQTIDLPDDLDMGALRDYVVQDRALTHDPLPPPTPSVDEQIAALKARLDATDYVVIKIAEGAATRDEYADLIRQRQAWRAQINELRGAGDGE